jgi:hypothetical protein
MIDLAAIATALDRNGLILRGGFNFAAEVAPAGPSDTPAKSILLIGNAGAGHWPAFQTWLAGQGGTVENPLDTWTKAVVEPIAETFGARAVFPSEKPYLPFQRWAMRAEALKPSPLGLLIHPRYGLWHAYRAALLFDVEMPIQPPCLNACPVGAHSAAGFAYRDCVDHVRGPGAACRDTGCLDRNACPFGLDFRYPVEVQAFHMAAFSRAAA